MWGYILSVAQNIRFSDAVDIAIIALFVYLLLIWFKRSRARFMLIGVIIVGGVYALARMCNLYLTTMAFQAFFAVFLVMIVIIFQDDFRHFFERVAVWGLRRRISLKKSTHLYVEILGSAFASLSRKGIGALVVIRGHDPLDRYLEAGVELDGVLSQIVLESIFDPHAPSHDGAVVVDGARITQFSCHLPLSTNIDEVGRHGTRHAAALGLSEQADSLCIVVSEETGEISVAEGGKIRQLSDIAQIQDVLQEYYQRKFPKRHRAPFIDFVTGHPLDKLIALILASTLWLTFAYRKEIIQRDFVVPIEYRNLSPERVIADAKPKEITVTLSGTDRLFNLFDPKELKVGLDLAEVVDGERTFTLSKDAVRYPSQLSLVNIEPREVSLKVYRFVTQAVPIVVKTTGRLPPKVTLKQITLEPKEVAVLFSSLLPQDKISVATEPVDISGISQTTTITSKLLLSPETRLADEKLSEVKVNVEVENTNKE